MQQVQALRQIHGIGALISALACAIPSSRCPIIATALVVDGFLHIALGLSAGSLSLHGVVAEHLSYILLDPCITHVIMLDLILDGTAAPV